MTPPTGGGDAAYEGDAGVTGVPSSIRLAEPEARPAPTPAAGPPSLEGASAADGNEGVPVHGSLLLRYRRRWTDDATDQDAAATLALDVGDERRHPVTAHVMARLWADPNGTNGSNVFFGLDDTFDSTLDATLYYAYVDVEDLETVERLRLGRQQLWGTPAFLVFDGGLIEVPVDEVHLGAYAGRRALFYDATSHDGTVGGVYGFGSPWEGARLRLDYMYLDDEERIGSGRNDLGGIELRQLLGDRVTLDGRFSALEWSSRDLRLHGQYFDPDEQLALEATYYSLLQAQRNEPLEINPYDATLRDYAPFEQYGLLATKTFGDRLGLSLGFDVRRLENGGDEGIYNHEFEHYSLSTIVYDLGLDELDLTLTGDVWSDTQQDVRTWGVDLSHQLHERVRWSLGSYYSLYKYDLFLQSERDDVRTYFARVRFQRSESLSFDVEYLHEDEDDDMPTFQTVWVRMRWLF